MIEFLRMRKEIKRIEEQRLERLKQKKEEAQRAKRTVTGSGRAENGIKTATKSPIATGFPQNAIAEDDNEN